MYSVDDMQKWMTLGGAVIAAVASVVNLWWTHRTNLDRLTVTFGSLSPPLAPGEALYIVSQSDHRVSLSDYGFISTSGGLLSYPLLEVAEPGDEYHCVTVRGKSAFEKRGDLFEIGSVPLGGELIGAYAVSAGSERMTLGFRYDLPFWKRCFIRMKIWRKRRYE